MKKVIKVLSVMLITLFFIFEKVDINAITENEDKQLTQEEIKSNLDNPDNKVKDKSNDELLPGKTKEVTNITRVENSGYKLAYVNGTNWAYWFDAWDSRGLNAYCIQPGAWMYGGQYSSFNPSYLSAAQIDRIRKVLYYGAPNMGNSQLDKFATQILITEAVTGVDHAVFTSSGVRIDTQAQENVINNNIANHYLSPSFVGINNISTNRNQTILLNDTNGILDRFTLQNVPEGTTVNKTGNQLYMTFTTPGTYTMILDKFPLHGHHLSQFYWQSGSSQNVASGSSFDPFATTFTVTVNEVFGDVSIQKYEPIKNTSVNGAVFELLKFNENSQSYESYTDNRIQTDDKETLDLKFDDQGNVITKVIDGITIKDVAQPYNSNFYTTKNGKLSLKNVAYGKYALREVYAPTGFLLNEELTKFEINTDGQKIEQYFPNTEITSSISLVKKDVDTNELLKGAVFELLKYDFNTNTYEPYYNERISQSLQEVGSTKPNPKPLDLKIDSNGNVLISELQDNQLVEVPKEFKNNYYITSGGYINLNNIPYGAYALKEVYEPFGHILNDELIQFNVSEDKAKIDLEFHNKEITSSISLSKIDSKTSELVEGAVFELLKYNFDTNTYEPYVNKRITNTVNLIGNTKPLKRPLDLQFDKSGKVLIPKIKNHEIKYDPMLYKENYYTSKNGVVHLNSVPYGVYALKEVYEPMGRILNEELIPFNVTEEGAVLELAFPNKEITSTIKFSKVDSGTKEILPGAKMTIEKYNFKTLQWEHFLNFTTVSTESIIENVAYGTYRVKELQAPSGYILKDLNLMFDVTEEGAVITLEFPNPKLPKTGVTDVTIFFILISGMLVFLRKLVN